MVAEKIGLTTFGLDSLDHVDKKRIQTRLDAMPMDPKKHRADIS